MFRRRLAFATPFVVVVACKRPVVPIEEPTRTMDGEAREQPTAHDAGIADAATVKTAMPDALSTATGPPPPRSCERHGNPCNPPAPKMEARVLDIEINGDATVIVVSKGQEDGVEMSWTACLLDDRDRCIDAPLTIRHVGPRRTTLVLTATDIMGRYRVRLERR